MQRKYHLSFEFKSILKKHITIKNGITIEIKIDLS